MEIKNLFAHTSSMWVRYSEYVIRTVDGTAFILPEDEYAEFTVYDAAVNATEAVTDALKYGKLIAADENDSERVEKAVLSFTKKYGSLGWMMELALEKSFDDRPQVFLGRRGGLLGNTVMPTEKYYDYFLRASEIPREEQYFPSRIAYTVGREAEYEKAFSVHYGEPLLWTAEWLQKLYYHFFSHKNYDKPEYTSTERGVMTHLASQYEHSGIGFFLNAKGQPQITWEFDSLMTVIETAYGLMLTDEAQPLRICKSCDEIYSNANARSEFCSVRCRNRFGVREFRKRGRE